MNPPKPFTIQARCEDTAWNDLPRDPAAFARRVLRPPLAELAPPGAEVSVLFASEPFIRKLNRKYRHINRRTDVLTFALSEGEDEPRESASMLGDIVISLDAAREQAAERGVKTEDVIALLLIHGLLHLLGRDHHDAASRLPMRATEDRWLRRLGFVSPYSAAPQ